MSFTVIETQEELDRIINDRLSRERDASAKKYEGYLSPADAAKKYEGFLSPDEVAKIRTEYEDKLTGLTASLDEANGKLAQGAETLAARDRDLADRDARIKDYETASLKARIAQETGLPYGLSDRLRGENEEAIRKDAQDLMQMTGQIHVAPVGASEPIATGKTSQSSLIELSRGLENM